MRVANIVFLASVIVLGCFLAILSSVDASNMGNKAVFGLFSPNGAKEVSSPGDHVKQNQIHVYEDRIVIEIPHANWAQFTDTNSMDPVLDKGANSIEVKPLTADDIAVGDIISYRSGYVSGIIVHRVIEKDEDSEGVYFIAKGDNNTSEDPERIRFDQIEGVLVAVIY